MSWLRGWIPAGDTDVGKKLIRLTVLAALALLVGLASVALVRNESVTRFLVERKLDQVLEDYADKVVLKTIARAVQDFRLLEQAAVRLRAEPTDGNAAAAAEAWRTARAQWKKTATFMFGPAAHYNFDKQLDTFPLDRPLVDHLLGEMAAGRVAVDERYLREELLSTQRGLPAAEYLLFRDGKPRRAKDMTPAELEYLVAATRAMTLESMDFEASWAGSSRMPADKAALLKAAGMRTRSSYADEFKHPGAPGSRYLSHSVALQEIFQESVAVTEDLGDAIAGELDSANPRGGRTWYSRNGRADLLNILKSVENAYLGGAEGDRGHSVSELLASRDEVLDRRIRIALADTAFRITEAAGPHGGNGEERELLVRRAESACHKLTARLSVAALLVAMDPSTRPFAPYGVPLPESHLMK